MPGGPPLLPELVPEVIAEPHATMVPELLVAVVPEALPVVPLEVDPGGIPTDAPVPSSHAETKAMAIRIGSANRLVEVIAASEEI
jgi:hypothetical protein